MERTNKTYLGDGVYASHDGYHAVLTTDGNEIFLDPGVIYCLQRFLEKTFNVKITVEKVQLETEQTEVNDGY